MKLNKKELEKQLEEIKKQKKLEIIKRVYPKYKKLEGTYYKIRNSFGCGDNEFWYMYIKVVIVKPEHVYIDHKNDDFCSFEGYSFQLNKYKELKIKTQHLDYIPDKRYQITEEEFNEAWNNHVVDFISKLNEK